MQSESHDLAQPAELFLSLSRSVTAAPPPAADECNGIDLSAIRVAECIFSTTAALSLTDGPTDGLHLFALWHAPRVVALTHLELALFSSWASVVLVVEFGLFFCFV